MTRSPLIIFMVLLMTGIMLGIVPESKGAEPALADENIHINADTLTQGEADGIVTATGHVVMLWQGLTITSDRASYENATRILTATGNVVMTKGKDVVRGESIKLNLETNLGELEKATLTSSDSSMVITGDKIVRLSENEFEIMGSELTTCDLPDPSWKFKAGSIKGNLLGYGIGRHVIFYVHDVPVMYLPWAAFPVVKDKTSGLLFPRFGYSNTRGAQADIPVYWVLSPSQDILFDVDAQTKRGVGLGTDYRYIRTRGSEGHLGGYLIYDLVKDEWRWQLSQNHKEIFSPDMNLRLDVNLNSDRTFLFDYGEKSGDYNRQSSDTTVNFLKTWQYNVATARIRYSENLYAKDDEQTLQVLPEFAFSTVRLPLNGYPFYFDSDAAISNLYRESGVTGQRLNLFPRVSFMTSPMDGINLSLWSGAHVRAYNTTDRQPGSGFRQTDADLLPELGLRVSTSLTRVFEPELAMLKKIRHEIVPELAYGYTPERNQQRLPLYDSVDRMPWQNVLTLSLTNMLTGRFSNGDTNEYRELSRIKLMQSYSFEGTRRDLLSAVDTGREWGNLILESDTWLNRLVRMTFDARYDHYTPRHRLASVAPGIEFDDRLGSTAALSYRMTRGEVEYLEGKLGTKLVKPFILSYSARYSFDGNEFLEAVYSAEYRHKCWSVIATLRDRRGNHSFSLNFNLAGLFGK